MLWLHALLIVACTKAGPPRGQLIVAIETDVALPDDIDKVSLTVHRKGKQVFEFDPQLRDVGAGLKTLLLPATLALVSSPKIGSDRTVTVKLAAFKGEEERSSVEFITQIPVSRVALLRMSIEWLCDVRFGADACGDQYTCVAGRCTSKTVDEQSLPDFVQDEVAQGPYLGCFDTAACMQDPRTLDVIRLPHNALETDCVALLPADLAANAVNVALVPAQPAGVCVGNDNGPPCYVVLEYGEKGWRPGPHNSIALPPAACDRLQSGKATGWSPLRAVRPVTFARRCVDPGSRSPIQLTSCPRRESRRAIFVTQR